MSKAIIQKLEDVLAEYTDHAPTRTRATGRKAAAKFRQKRAAAIMEKTGLTEYQLLRGVASGAIKVEVDAGYSELCKAEKKKQEEKAE